MASLQWLEPDWSLLRSRVSADVLESVMDTPGLNYDELLRSQEWRRPRWVLDI